MSGSLCSTQDQREPQVIVQESKQIEFEEDMCMLACSQMAATPVLFEIWCRSALRCLMTLVSSNQGLECGMTFVIFPNSLGSFYLSLRATGARS